MKTITLYSFSELSPKAQEFAVEELRLRDDLLDPHWYVPAKNAFHQQLVDYGFNDPTIYWSEVSCQGDGACFTCESVDWRKFIQASKSQKTFARLLRHQDKIEMTFSIISIDSHYSHSNTITSRGDYRAWNWDLSSEKAKAAEALTYDEHEQLERFMLQEARRLSDAFYNELRRVHWEETFTPANARAKLEESDLEFYEDGTLYSETPALEDEEDE